MNSKTLKVLSNINNSDCSWKHKTLVVKFFNNFWKYSTFWGLAYMDCSSKEEKIAHISQHFFSMSVDEQFPVLLLLYWFHFLWCLSVSQLTVTLSEIDSEKERNGWLPVTEVIFFFYLSQPSVPLAEFSLSRQLSVLLLKCLCWCVLSLSNCQ